MGNVEALPEWLRPCKAPRQELCNEGSYVVPESLQQAYRQPVEPALPLEMKDEADLAGKETG